MSRIGFVALDTDGKWIGGRYYLHHLIKSVASLPSSERLDICDVWWLSTPKGEDPFEEVRKHVAEQVVIAPPRQLLGRLKRKILKLFTGDEGVSDLFQDRDIGVVFPRLPCESVGIPYIFWLADFQYIHYPELFGQKLCDWYRNNYSTNVELADQVVVSSKYALNDFEKEYPEHINKVRVLNFCSVPDEEWWCDDPETIASMFKLPDLFFVLSNQFSHHKNHSVIFDAVRILKEKGIEVTLACTGSTWGFRGDDYFEGLSNFIDQHQLHDQIKVLGMLPRSQQVALMRRSIAMLQPSMFEGWSTVVEDARTLGKILLVSNIDVHREQMGDRYEHYVPVSDPEKWAEKMEAILQDAKPGPDLVLEKSALQELEQRKQKCGLDFLDVVSKAMAKKK